MMVTLRIGAFGISLLLVVDFDYGHLAHVDLGGSRCWRVMWTLVAVGVGESSFSLKFLLLQCD